MEYKKLSTEQIALLKKPLPPEAVKQHPTKTFLSSIKAIYEIERLNDVFGIGAWQLRSAVIDASTPMIVVKSILTVPEYGIELESFGGNDNGGENSKNHDLGDAYKGACTDALTKVCSYLGIGMDVYKGLFNPPANSTPAGTPPAKDNTRANDMPWLNENTDEYKEAIKKLKAGTTTITKIKTVRRVSKATEAKLMEAIKK